MRTAAQQLGDDAERLVANRLTVAGWTILGHQVRVGRAEIDLIAVDPGPPRTLVFVEVRWRAGRAFGLAEETVGHAKRSRLHMAAYRLLEASTSRLPRLPVRFDLIAVEPGGRIRHHRHGA